MAADGVLGVLRHNGPSQPAGEGRARFSRACFGMKYVGVSGRYASPLFGPSVTTQSHRCGTATSGRVATSHRREATSHRRDATLQRTTCCNVAVATSHVTCCNSIRRDAKLHAGQQHRTKCCNSIRRDATSQTPSFGPSIATGARSATRCTPCCTEVCTHVAQRVATSQCPSVGAHVTAQSRRWLHIAVRSSPSARAHALCSDHCSDNLSTAGQLPSVPLGRRGTKGYPRVPFGAIGCYKGS
jgi:hypothetical protein